MTASESQTWWLSVDTILSSSSHYRKVYGPYPSKKAAKRAGQKRDYKSISSCFVTKNLGFVEHINVAFTE